MIFGTDGVRGVVNKSITHSIAYDIGKGFAIRILKKKLPLKVLIGCDTRLSNDLYVSAISSGLMDYGIDVVFVGIASTPVVSFLVSKLNIAGGIMVTASHNDYTYNGIKIFDEFGEKLDKKSEDAIEKYMSLDFDLPLYKGHFKYDSSMLDKYIKYLIDFCNFNLNNYTIVLDCANGSNYSIAPIIFKSLGANVIKVACSNDGYNINNNCGANHIDNVKKQVIEHNADFGFAFDGDGDRLRIVLNDGKIMSGDDILLLFSLYLKDKQKLNNMTIVGTIMTNNGLEKYLNSFGIKLIRTDVGDKNVISKIKQNRLSLGGESSGHICLYEHNPSCDALFNSLFFLKCVIEDKFNVYDILNIDYRFHSISRNIEIDYDFRINFDKNKSLSKAIKNLSKQYKDAKIVIRPSGTEPVLRVYIESLSVDTNKNILMCIEKILKNTA